MITSDVKVAEGIGKNVATWAITEDAETKQLQRVGLSDSAGAEILPATVAGQATTNAGLSALLTALAATLNTSDTGSHTTLASILAKVSADPATNTTLAAVLAKLSADPATNTTLAAVLAKISADPANNTTLTGTNTKLDSVVAAIAALASETLWTDNTSAYFVRVDKAGVISWTTLLGVTSAAPGTGARPAATGTGGGGGSSGATESLWTDDSGVFYIRINTAGVITWSFANGTTTTAPGADGRPAAGPSIIMDKSAYQATIAGSGYSVGDFLNHYVTADPASGAIVAHFWINATTEAKLTTAPTSANISPVSAIVSGGATSANQTSQITQETAINTVLGVKTDARSALTDGTSISSMSVWKQISFSMQALVAVFAAGLNPNSRAAAAASSPAVLSNEDFAALGALTEVAPTTDIASSGLNGRLQRIAQRITSLIALLPAALGAGGGLKVDGSGTALPVSGAFWQATQPVSGAFWQATQPISNSGAFPTQAAMETSQISNAGTGLTPKFAIISASTSGSNNSIVALVTGKKIRVLAWDLKVNAAVNFKWQSNQSTDKTGLYYCNGQGDGVARAFCPVGYFETVAGEPLTLNLSGATAVGGVLTYIEV